MITYEHIVATRSLRPLSRLTSSTISGTYNESEERGEGRLPGVLEIRDGQTWISMSFMGGKSSLIFLIAVFTSTL